jgi:hypothetical protein
MTDQNQLIFELTGERPKNYNIRVKPITTTRKAPDEQQVRDCFQTPAYATDLLIPFIPKDITQIWEPAYGGGKISRQLRKSGYTVFESDLKSDDPSKIFNFISGENKVLPEKISIITNPPFSVKDMFIEKCFEYGKPWALLINMDYSQWHIDLIKRGCEKIIPDARISYVTPLIVSRVNEKEGTDYLTVDDIPMELLYKYTSAQFHSGWMTWGFGLGRTETFVDLPIEQRRYNI